MNGEKGKYAWTVKIGEKGQFVIPKEGREMLGIKPGDTIVVLGDVERGLAILPKDKMEQFISQMFGAVGMGGKEEGKDE